MAMVGVDGSILHVSWLGLTVGLTGFESALRLILYDL